LHVEDVDGGHFFGFKWFLATDRAIVDDLKRYLFSKPDPVARNSSAFAFDEVVGTFKLIKETGDREFYSVAEGDCMRITIQEQGAGPNGFKFELHSSLAAEQVCSVGIAGSRRSSRSGGRLGRSTRRRRRQPTLPGTYS